MPPLRQITRKYSDLTEFLSEYHGALTKGAVVIPGDQINGELQPEFKLDLNLPLVGRVGPISAQVVARLPDGGVAARIPEMPGNVTAAIQRLIEGIELVRQHLVATGALVEAGASRPPVAPTTEDDELIDDLPTGPGQSEAPEPAPAPAPPPAPPPAPAPAPAPAVPPPGPAPEEPAAPPRRQGYTLPEALGKPALTGKLDDGTLRRALVTLATRRATGVLLITYPEGRQRVGYWSAGGPVGWRSDPLVDDELLGALLERSGQVSAAQVAESRRLMESTDCRQGEALVQMGVLKVEQLGPVLNRQSEFVLMRVLQDRKGVWAWHDLPQLPDSFLAPPVGVLGLLFRAFVNHGRKVPAKTLLEGLKKQGDRSVYLRPDAVAGLREVRYAREEALILDAVRTRAWKLADLVERGPVGAEQGAPVIWTLIELGLLEVGKAESQEQRLDRLRPRLEAKVTQVERGTPFDVLELHWICTGADVTRNAARLREELGQLGALPEELKAMAERVRAGVEEAARALGDDASRRARRAALIRPEDLAQCVALLEGRAREAEEDQDPELATRLRAQVQDLRA